MDFQVRRPATTIPVRWTSKSVAQLTTTPYDGLPSPSPSHHNPVRWTSKSVAQLTTDPVRWTSKSVAQPPQTPYDGLPSPSPSHHNPVRWTSKSVAQPPHPRTMDFQVRRPATTTPYDGLPSPSPSPTSPYDGLPSPSPSPTSPCHGLPSPSPSSPQPRTMDFQVRRSAPQTSHFRPPHWSIEIQRYSVSKREWLERPSMRVRDAIKESGT